MKMKIVQKTATFCKDHSEQLLLGMGIAGGIASTIVACKQTVKAIRLVDKLESESGKKLTKKEKFRACWKLYLIPGALEFITATALVLSGTESARKKAILISLCEASKDSLQSIMDKTEEIVGEKKMSEINKAVAQDDIDKHPITVQKDSLPKSSPNADMLCYDKLTGHYFLSTWEDLNSAINELNYALNCGMDDGVRYSEWLYSMHLNSIWSEASEEYEWIQSRDGFLEYAPEYTSDDKEYPCVYIAFNTMPSIRKF